MIRRTYVFPNLITIMSMFAGFYSIIASLNDLYVNAAYAILVSFVFDGLDGKVARLLNATSDFGVQLDSLSDLVAFGVAPAVLIYKWLLIPYGRIGWMAAFLFVACGALRLARFNVQAGKVDSTFFVGLPIPAAAGVIASSVLFVKEFFGDPYFFSIPLGFVFLIYALAFLMVSNFPYYSFKKVEWISVKPFNILVSFVLVIFLLGLYPEVMLFIFFVAFAISGIVTKLLRLHNKKSAVYSESGTKQV
ncbi:MAG: CDP-diacylglycerol--serine O-phosphatidyltransferase [Calditerrivibrio sp.]|nr:CDP-diacylglycerol--serine O-phosphatidyltransferase [Calditerrivibrio sp.]